MEDGIALKSSFASFLFSFNAQTRSEAGYPAMAAPAPVLRLLLRRSSVPLNHPVRESIKQDFREALVQLNTPGKGQQKGDLRRFLEHAALLESVQKQQKLFEDYGIGAAIDQREKLRRTGKRVGFELPDFADEVDRSLEAAGDSAEKKEQ
jgi:hypothetical protein